MFTVFDAHADAYAWRCALEKLPPHARDIYGDPYYLRLFCFEPGTRGTCTVFEQGDQVWLHAFLLQPYGDGYHDIETAYGYGGPWSNSDDPDFISAAHAAYTDWLESQQVIAEFLRLHPIIQNEALVEGAVERDRVTCSIDLTQEVRFIGKARNKLKRAIKEGLQVERVSAVEHINAFQALYDANMEILGADSFYRFSREHFLGLAEVVGAQGFMLAGVLDGKWVAASMFLYAGPYLHYHLSATDFEARVPGAVNLILKEAAEIGQSLGCERLHLGGGRTAADDDSLLAFKRSIRTDEHVFNISKRVVNEARYTAVCEAWRKAEPEMAERFGHRILCYRYCS